MNGYELNRRSVDALVGKRKNSFHFYKDGLFVQYHYECNAWKEKVNHVDRYYFEHKLSKYTEEKKSPEWYSDIIYARKLHHIRDLLNDLNFGYFKDRRYDRETKKIIPFTQKQLKRIEDCCIGIMEYCELYSETV